MDNVHSQLIRRISSHHVLYNQTSSWVQVLPGVETEHMAVGDDQCVAGGDEALNLPAGEDTSWAWFGGDHGGGGDDV